MLSEWRPCWEFITCLIVLTNDSRYIPKDLIESENAWISTFASVKGSHKNRHARHRWDGVWPTPGCGLSAKSVSSAVHPPVFTPWCCSTTNTQTDQLVIKDSCEGWIFLIGFVSPPPSVHPNNTDVYMHVGCGCRCSFSWCSHILLSFWEPLVLVYKCKVGSLGLSVLKSTALRVAPSLSSYDFVIRFSSCGLQMSG